MRVALGVLVVALAACSKAERRAEVKAAPLPEPGFALIYVSGDGHEESVTQRKALAQQTVKLGQPLVYGIRPEMTGELLIRVDAGLAGERPIVATLTGFDVEARIPTEGVKITLERGQPVDLTVALDGAVATSLGIESAPVTVFFSFYPGDPPGLSERLSERLKTVALQQPEVKYAEIKVILEARTVQIYMEAVDVHLNALLGYADRDFDPYLPIIRPYLRDRPLLFVMNGQKREFEPGS